MVREKQELLVQKGIQFLQTIKTFCQGPPQKLHLDLLEKPTPGEGQHDSIRWHLDSPCQNSLLQQCFCIQSPNMAPQSGHDKDLYLWLAEPNDSASRKGQFNRSQRSIHDTRTHSLPEETLLCNLKKALESSLS